MEEGDGGGKGDLLAQLGEAQRDVWTIVLGAEASDAVGLEREVEDEVLEKRAAGAPGESTDGSASSLFGVADGVGGGVLCG